MSLIALNGDSTVPQPSDLTEEYTQVRRLKSTITGASRQIWFAQKRQATFTLSALTQTQFEYINSMIAGGNPIHYQNSTSNWDYYGFATVATDKYWRGASLLRDMSIVLLEM